MSGVMTAVTEHVPLLVAAVLIVLATLALVLRLRKFESKVESLLARSSEYRDKSSKDKGSREELRQWKTEIHAELQSLRAAVQRIPPEIQRLIAANTSQTQVSAPPPRPSAGSRDFDFDDEPYRAEDGVVQLLSIANRLVQQSTTLDAFRASTSGFTTQVFPYPAAIDGTPTAFIVEQRGSYYAIPNVVKPARFPKEWFNRSEFGVNDEIRSVVSLPRLRRRGSDFEVQEPGVFAR